MRLAACLVLLTLGVAALLGRGGERADCRRPRLVGTWLGVVTAEEPPLGRLQDLITFEPAGTLIESRRAYVPQAPLGPLLQSNGHGRWAPQVGGEGLRYHARFVFLLQGAPDHPELAGMPLGTDTVTLELAIEGDDHLTGTFESEVRDARGDRVFTVRGSYAGGRLDAPGRDCP